MLPISRDPLPVNEIDGEIDEFARVRVAPDAMLMVPEPVIDATDIVAFPLIVRVAPDAMLMVPEPVKDKDDDILFSIVRV